MGGATEVAVEAGAFRRRAGAGKAGGSAAVQTWTLPVCVKTSTGEAACTIVTEREQTIKAPGCGAAMVNADARGYYFTEYEPAAVAALATRTPPLTSAERISLLGDEWRMMRAGRHEIGPYLDLSAAFARDTNPAVAGDIAARLGFVTAYVADAGQRPAFKAWIRVNVPARARCHRCERLARRHRRHQQPARHPAAAAGR